MKAFVIDHYKGPLSLREMPEPVPGPEDVIVAIRAAAVNPLDCKIAAGEFKQLLPYSMPLILGNDLAGVVTQIGQSVTRFSPGDEVYARPRQDRIGTFAEKIAVHQDDLAHKPGNLSMAEAASIPLVALTAWQALVECARLRAGQKVLIHAGAGGVGSIAIQLAKHFGATVATTASAQNAPWLYALGADTVIDYREDDFREKLSGYDVVLNSLDAKTLHQSLDVLKPGGKLISISGPPDPEYGKAQKLGGLLTLIFRLLSWRIRQKAKRRQIDYRFLFMEANGVQLEQLTRRIEDGVIQPVIDRTYPFAQTAEALAYVAQGRAKGKVVVTNEDYEGYEETRTQAARSDQGA